MSNAEIQKKVLEAYIKNTDLESILNSIPDLSDDDKEYAMRNITFKVEDVKIKEKAIENILWLLGEAGLNLSLGEDEEGNQ